jgi:hypothetical protein
LKSARFPGTSHDDIQTTREERKFDRFCSPRKTSPSAIATQSRDHRDIGLSAAASPENLHLRRRASSARSPNPLTLFPDAAHACP